MAASILRRLVVLSVVVTTLACGPVQATSGTRAQLGEPQWLEQTVYRPNSPVIESDCGCGFDPERCDRGGSSGNE